MSTLHGSADAPLLCFGGPYSNLAATRAMRATANRLGIGPERVICTGDVVAYCAHPNETIAEIRDWGCHVIKGNCEEQLAARADDCGCGFGDGSTCDLLSRGWYGFADAALEDDHRAWMAGLPAQLDVTIGGQVARAVHGGVRETSRFIFASTPEADKNDELDVAGTDLIIAGHCGLPFMQQIGDKVWFNPGVIGMPANDGTADVWFGLIEPVNDDRLRFSTHRLSYDAAAEADALESKGFAAPYAAALRTGLWPSLDVLPESEKRITGERIAETVLTVSVTD